MAKYDTHAYELVVIILALCMAVARAQDPCASTSYINKYNPNRNPFFTIDYSNPICDSTISSGQWVAFYAPGQDTYGFKVPETCVMPYHCGTQLPIWINGIHPNASYPGPVDLQACHSGYPIYDCCGWNAIIQVKWCSPGFYVYKLQSPETCYSAYCFNNLDQPLPPPYPILLKTVIRDPFISDFKPVNWLFPKTDLTFGQYTFNATKFSIGCSVEFGFMQGNLTMFGSPVIEVDLIVVEGVNTRSLLPQGPFKLTSLTPTEFLIGEQYISGNLDKPIMCSARSYWSNHPNFPSPTLYSRAITLEFKIQTNPPREVKQDRIIILDERDSIELWLEPNFPVTFGHCFGEGLLCQPYQFPIKPGPGLDALSLNCAIKVYPDVVFPVEVVHPKSIMYISAPQTLGTRSSPFSVEIDFVPVALFPPTTNSIFSNQYKPPSIYITITDTQQRPVCSSTGDPHIIPFSYNGTEYYYHMMSELGDFYLVTLKNSNRVFEIQVQHRPCMGWPVNPNEIKCNCGVYIREGNNVVGINNCGNSSFVNRIVKYQTVTQDSNGYKLPSPLLEEIATNQWHITMLSGVEVHIVGDAGNLHIFVIGLAHEEYGGLCTPGTIEDTAQQYRVPEAESLFSHLADCVDEDIPLNRCSCEKNDTTTDTVLQICKTTAPVTTLTVQTQCNKNVTVTGPSTGVLPALKRKKRSTDNTHDPYSILVPAEYILSPISPENSAPINNQWPTPNTGITESQAVAKCQSVFEKSPAYHHCAEYAKSLQDSCVIDIQVSETLDVADTYLYPFNIQCQYKEESSIIQNADGTSANGADKVLQQIKAVLCPADCTYKNDVRGTCVNGTCQCYDGFKGMDCSIKIGDPPKIIDFYQNIMDYTSGNSTTKDEILILIAAENVDYVNVTQISCRFTINSAIGSDRQTIQKTYPGVRLLGGLVACWLKPDASLTGALYHVNVSLSNDGATYSAEKFMIVHDGNCTQCTKSSDCSITAGKCTVGGVCSKYSGGMEGCDQTSSVETTTEGIFTTAADICQYLNYDNQHSWYGNPKPGIKTLDECKRVCCEDSTCMGLDFDTHAQGGTVACWFHTDIGMVDSTREPSQGVMQRIKLSCRHCDSVSWTQNPNKNSFGAERQNGITTLAACQDFCACKKNCQGLDYVKINNDCWIHTSSDAIKTKHDNNDVDQYVVICNKPSGDCYRWEILEQTQSIGALYYQDYLTLDSCLKHCQDLDDCVGADISTGSTSIACWLHRSKSDADKTRRPAANVNQHLLRRCKSDSCASLWLPYPGYQSYGGSQIAGANTTEACRTACEGLSNCVAVDFDLSSNSCWWQSDPSSVTKNRVSNSMVNQYQLLRSQNCRDTVTWELNQGKQSYGAQRADGVTTLDDCKNVCTDDLTCVAVEFDHSNTPSECWVHRNINNIISKSSNSNIDQYVIKRL